MVRVNCAYRGDASSQAGGEHSDGCGDGGSRGACSTGAVTSHHTCRWQPNELHLMLQQQRYAAGGGNAWNYNEVIIDGRSFLRDRSKLAYYVTPWSRVSAGGQPIAHMSRDGTPVICFDPRKHFSPFLPAPGGACP